MSVIPLHYVMILTSTPRTCNLHFDRSVARSGVLVVSAAGGCEICKGEFLEHCERWKARCSSGVRPALDSKDASCVSQLDLL